MTFEPKSVCFIKCSISPGRNIGDEGAVHAGACYISQIAGSADLQEEISV